jgi:uncharacterized OB-fold protein
VTDVASQPVQSTRRLPALTIDNEFFWRAGERGVLQIARCGDCGYYVHPPAPRCARCLSAAVHPSDVSGRAVVEAFTVNVEPWEPELTEPYVVAIVSLVEQPSVRLTTNIVNCPVDEVAIGMPVHVVFEHDDGIYLPLFEADGR